MPLIVLLVILFCIIVLPSIKVVQQYERGVVFRLGKFDSVRNPGLTLVLPYIYTMRKVDVRSTPIDVPKQEVITKDNVTVGVDAIV